MFVVNISCHSFIEIIDVDIVVVVIVVVVIIIVVASKKFKSIFAFLDNFKKILVIIVDIHISHRWSGLDGNQDKTDKTRNWKTVRRNHSRFIIFVKCCWRNTLHFQLIFHNGFEVQLPQKFGKQLENARYSDMLKFGAKIHNLINLLWRNKIQNVDDRFLDQDFLAFSNGHHLLHPSD